MKAQSTVACDLHLRNRGLTVYALGEDAPCDFLGNGCLRSILAERLLDELPRFFSAIQIPAASAFTGNVDLNVGSVLCRNGAIGERQCPQKAIQNGIVEFAGHYAWFVHRQPDLLLVVPAFRECPGGVEPVCRLVFTCPTDTERGLRKRIPGGVILREEFGGDFHQGNQDSRTQPPIETDAFLIQTIDVGREFSARADSGGLGQIAIAANGDPTQRGVQQVCGNVLDLPLRRNRLLFPVLGRKRAKKFDQHSVEFWKKVCGEHGLQWLRFGGSSISSA